MPLGKGGDRGEQPSINNTPPNHHHHPSYLLSTGAAAAAAAAAGGGAAPAATAAEASDRGGGGEAVTSLLPPEMEDDDVRVAMIGNVDSGKSTLIGVLTHASLDDGRGGARKLVLKHRHEQENGWVVCMIGSVGFFLGGGCMMIDIIIYIHPHTQTRKDGPRR